MLSLIPAPGTKANITVLIRNTWTESKLSALLASWPARRRRYVRQSAARTIVWWCPAGREPAATSQAASAPSYPTAILSPNNSVLGTSLQPSPMCAPHQNTYRGSAHDLGGRDRWTTSAYSSWQQEAMPYGLQAWLLGMSLLVFPLYPSLVPRGRASYKAELVVDIENLSTSVSFITQSTPNLAR